MKRAATAVLVCVAAGCADQENFARTAYRSALDTLQTGELITAFEVPDGFAMVLHIADTSDQAILVRYEENMPVIIDTLLPDSAGKFRSRRHAVTYYLQSDTVKEVHRQKIIHPSSNWQGQTPWQETIVSEYPVLKDESR